MDQMEGDKLVDSFQMQNRVSRISKAQVFFPVPLDSHPDTNLSTNPNPNTNTNTTNTNINNSNTNAKICKVQVFLPVSILPPFLVPLLLLLVPMHPQ